MTSQALGQQGNLLEQALDLHSKGQVERAKALYEQMLTREPKNAEVLRLLGTAQYQLGDREGCVRSLTKSVEFDPKQPETLYNLATALGDLDRHEEAVTIYDRALALKPDYAEAHYNRGNALLKCEQLEEAIASYDRALALKPNYARAYYNRGSAQAKAERFVEALASYDAATALQPNYVEAWQKKANLFRHLGRLEEALACLDRITSLKPDDISTWRDKAHLLTILKRLNEALSCYDVIAAREPHDSDLWCNKGCVLWSLNRREEAHECFNKAIAIEPNYSEAWFNKGQFLAIYGRIEEALACYERVQSLNASYDFFLGQVMHYRAHLALWDDVEKQRKLLTEGIAQGQKVATPFIVHALIDSADAHRGAAETFIKQNYPASQVLPPLTKHKRRDRIRIGYFSSDFHDHPVAHLMAGVFERHDSSRFETFAFAFGPDRQDSWRERVFKAVDHVIDVRSKTEHEIAELARSHEIDIAIDLNGFTRDCKTGIFAERAAPVQASYIGYLGTMGAPYIDYLIADPIIIPEDKRSFYTEKIVSLPSYQANDDRMPISERVFTRAELGLPEQAFVFCSFNNAYKITPDVFDSWMRILQRVTSSVLWLYASHPGAIPNLKREAEARGVSGERLVFATKMPLEEHLARQRLADLFLDTHPYNAGATASNALRVGLPVLTRLGESFPARMGASILTAAGVPELITHSVEEYEALAVALATDRERLSAIRQTLMASLPTCALFDTARFTRSLEAAYAAMYERNQNDLPPDHIAVSGEASHGKQQNDAIVSPAPVISGSEPPQVSGEASFSQEEMLRQALSLHQEGQVAEAKALYEKILAVEPDHAEVLRLLGTAEYQLGDREASIKALSKSLSLSPQQPETCYNLGVALADLKRHEEAVDYYNQAIALKPDYSEAYYNLGNSLLKLKRYEEAVATYEKALVLKPDYAKAYYNRGTAQKGLRQFEQALDSFDKAIAIKPNYFESYHAKAGLLTDRGRLDEGLACYEKALSLKPDHEFLLGDVLHARGHLACWRQFDSQIGYLIEQVSNGRKVTSPFPALALIDSCHLHKVIAEGYNAEKHRQGDALPFLKKNGKHNRIRIGYFSSDFGDHPVSHLMAGVFGHHDRSRFEIFAFALGPDRQHEGWRQRVVNDVEHFVDVGLDSDELEIAKLARSHEIDIAIDLNGYTGHAQTNIFAERAAPVQASYIGYLGTMGAPYIDYLIADPIIIPEDKRSFYTEKIVSLPSYQANDDRMPISERVFTRTELGLPEQAFVFCSFNNAYKITPDVFDSWMRILKRVPSSVLWLYTNQPTTVANLKREAEARGVSGERLVFAAKIPLEEHLARQRAADLFLDTHPYNAGATASNALRVGLPVLTRLGQSFPARMGSSIVTAAGIPELVTHSIEEYEALAVALATDPQRLSGIRQKLMANLPTCALFDTARFTRSLEAAYMAMYERCQNDLPPDHIDVAKLVTSARDHNV